MLEPTQAACSCVRGEHKPPCHVKLTSVFKIWETQYLRDMQALCLAAQKGVLLSANTTLCGSQLLEKEQGNSALDHSLEFLRS